MWGQQHQPYRFVGFEEMCLSTSPLVWGVGVTLYSVPTNSPSAEPLRASQPLRLSDSLDSQMLGTSVGAEGS